LSTNPIIFPQAPQTLKEPPLLQDNFGRTIDYLRLSITDRCNLRCRYCMPESGVDSLPHHDVLSYEEFLRITRLAIALGVRKVRITGGEPLVRRGLIDFIRQLRALDAHLELALTTNGILLANMAEELKTAGLNRINVSLDSLNPDRFREISRRDGLTDVLAGLQRAAAVGLAPLKINMVPIRGVNDDEIEAFAGLARDNPWEIRFIEYMPVSEGLAYAPSQRVGAEEIIVRLQRLGHLTAVSTAATAGPANCYRLAGYAGQIGIIPAVSQHFCGECNRLRLTADGRLRPCLFSTEELDLRRPMRAGADDAELRDLLLLATGSKPRGHRIGSEDFAPASRRMHGIGG
jgi:cyclic pyranopterin phosphate synthase